MVLVLISNKQKWNISAKLPGCFAFRSTKMRGSVMHFEVSILAYCTINHRRDGSASKFHLIEQTEFADYVSGHAAADVQVAVLCLLKI